MNYWGIFFSFIFIPTLTALIFFAAYWLDKVNQEA